MDTFIVTCEHGGNRIPEPYQVLFQDCGPLLATHRGYDFGALEMAQALAETWQAPLLTSTVSRLLIDLNRSIGHRHAFSTITLAVSAEIRQRIVDDHYRPYRSQVELLVAQAVERGDRVIHLSSHSFTPELNGTVRTADVGLLYDPARPGEAEMCARWKKSLGAQDCELRVRRNYPYAGKEDGLTSYLRTRFDPTEYVGIELEVNQRFVITGDSQWKLLQRRLIDSATAAFFIGSKAGVH